MPLLSNVKLFFLFPIFMYDDVHVLLCLSSWVSVSGTAFASVLDLLRVSHLTSGLFLVCSVLEPEDRSWSSGDMPLAAHSGVVPSLIFLHCALCGSTSCFLLLVFR